MLKTLSMRNAKRQVKDYLIYFITVAISVSLLYAFNSLIFSKEIGDLSSMMSSMPYIIVAASVAIVLIIGWLVSYMTAFMLKKRSRELGTYMLLGIENKDVAEMYFRENTTIGIFALIIGMIAGSLISQIIKAVVVSAFHLTYHFTFEISLPTILVTIIYWAIIFFFALRKNKKRINSMKIYDLLYFDKQNEAPVTNRGKSRNLLLCISAVSGIGSIFLFYTAPGSVSSSSEAFIGTVLGIIFLYGFYISIASVIIDYFNTHKNKKYKRNTLFLFRSYTSKASTMSIMVATLALLFTATIAVLGFGTQMNQLMEYQATEYNVYDLCISHDNEAYDFEPYQAYVKENLSEIEQHAYSIYNAKTTEFRELLDDRVDASYLEYDSYMKQSDYYALRDLLGYDSVDIPQNAYYVHCIESIEPTVKAYAKENSSVVLEEKTLTFGGVSTELFNQETWSGNGSHFIIIVPDELAEEYMDIDYSLYAVMSEKDIDLKHIDTLERMASELSEVKDAEEYEADYVVSRARYEEGASVITVMIVVPLFYVSFILMITAITILATQQLSDSSKYKYQYTILRNLGMSEKELAKTIKHQMLIYFTVPIIPSLLFGSLIIRWFSLSIWNGAIAGFARMATCFGFSIGIFLLIYGIYFAASYTSFKRAILE